MIYILKSSSKPVSGCRIGRIRVIFRLPPKTFAGKSHNYPTYPLAHIEWYSKLKSQPENYYGMYSIKKQQHLDGIVVPLLQIRQGCSLFPDFRCIDASDLTTENVLDYCDSFYLNPFQSRYTYQTLY